MCLFVQFCGVVVLIYRHTVCFCWRSVVDLFQGCELLWMGWWKEWESRGGEGSGCRKVNDLVSNVCQLRTTALRLHLGRHDLVKNSMRKQHSAYPWKTIVKGLAGSLLLVGLAWCGMGCTSAYQEARQIDSIDSYTSFIKKNPDSKYRQAALRRLDELYFNRAAERHTKESYTAYLRRYPRGRHRSRALRQIETIAFQAARRRGTMKSFQLFIREFPTGQFATDAKERIESLFYQKALRYRSYVGMQRYLEYFPQGRFRVQAEEKIREFWWFKILKKPTIPSISKWLRRFPAGRYSNDARKRIVLMEYRQHKESGKWWLLKRWMEKHPTHPLRKDAEALIPQFRRVYPDITKARRLMEAGERKKSVRLYKRLYRRYRRKPAVEKLLVNDLKRFKLIAEVIN